MKKRIISVLAAAAVIIACAGCVMKNDDKKETGAATTTTAAGTTVTTAATTAETTTAASQEPDPNKTVLLTLPGGKIIYSEDGTTVTEWEGGFIKSYNTGYVRISTGLYHDSVSEPDLFDTEDFIYSGDKAEVGEIREVKPGDTFGGLTVKETEMQVSNQGDSGYIFMNNVKLDGEITLTGIMSYYYDEQYGINSGDILFTPDSCYKGLPMACNPTMERALNMAHFDVYEVYNDDGIDKIKGSGPSYYSDAPDFRLGNLFENYAGNGELNDVTNGGNSNITRKVQVTLSDINLIYSDQFGTNRCSAVIKSIKAL